jgi:hypothetical protein
MTIKRAARLAAYLLILGLLGWDIYLLTTGLPATRFAEGFPGTPGLVIETVHRPYLPAWYSLAALLPLALGLLRDEWLPLAWLGLLLHLVVGGLLLFSIGFWYVPIIGLLAVAIGVLQWQASQRARWLLASAGGVAVVLLVGVLMNWTPLGVPLLVAGGLLALLLIALWRLPPNALGA